jgi:hypothetical protein
VGEGTDDAIGGCPRKQKNGRIEMKKVVVGLMFLALGSVAFADGGRKVQEDFNLPAGVTNVTTAGAAVKYLALKGNNAMALIMANARGLRSDRVVVTASRFEARERLAAGLPVTGTNNLPKTARLADALQKGPSRAIGSALRQFGDLSESAWDDIVDEVIRTQKALLESPGGSPGLSATINRMVFVLGVEPYNAWAAKVNGDGGK